MSSRTAAAIRRAFSRSVTYTSSRRGGRERGSAASKADPNRCEPVDGVYAVLEIVCELHCSPEAGLAYGQREGVLHDAEGRGHDVRQHDHGLYERLVVLEAVARPHV